MSTIRRFRSIAISAFFGLVALGAVAAYALPNYEVTTTYFSNPSRTIEVGSRILHCDGSVSTEGRTSSYYTRTQERCY